jgi:hypothetical protein
MHLLRCFSTVLTTTVYNLGNCDRCNLCLEEVGRHVDELGDRATLKIPTTVTSSRRYDGGLLGKQSLSVLARRDMALESRAVVRERTRLRSSFPGSLTQNVPAHGRRDGVKDEARHHGVGNRDFPDPDHRAGARLGRFSRDEVGARASGRRTQGILEVRRWDALSVQRARRGLEARVGGDRTTGLDGDSSLRDLAVPRNRIS